MSCPRFQPARFQPGHNRPSSAGGASAAAGCHGSHARGLDPVWWILSERRIRCPRWQRQKGCGDLGDGLWSQNPVLPQIVRRFPVSLELGILAIIMSVVIGLPIGVWSAIRQDTAGDYLGRTFAIGMLALPNFWLATLIVVFPAVWWGWSPPVEYIPLAEDPWGNLRQFIIPAFLMGTGMSATTMRMTRTMMLEVLRQDYIRTAWSKGLSGVMVINRHALKNALIPVVTVVGMQMPVLIGGTVIMEQIFVLPGVGRLVIEAVQGRDYTMISGINIFLAAFVLIVNLIVDLSYAFLDPRIRYS